MALNPHSEQPDLSLPDDYKADHPDEHPEDWGWHGEWGRTSRIAGWVCVVLLVLMTTSTHYNNSGTMWLLAFAGILVVGLLWDMQRNKKAYRR